MIDVRGVSVRLGGTRILDSVSARVEEGRFVGLVGPNGAGKSTLLRTINGVLSPAAGEVFIDGEDIHDLSSKAASRRVAAVPQNTSLSFAFDVRDVVAMGRTPYRSRFRPDDAAGDGSVEAALDRTDTARFADRAMDAVSGGERQRVLLARALAQDTPVLLLDEPTASLDINHRIRTLELVRDLVREGKTVIAAIHDLNLAARYCDDLLLLADGRVLDSGPPEAVLTKESLARAFDARAVVSRHPVTGAVFVTALSEATADRNGRVHVVGGGTAVSGLLYTLAAAGYEVSVGALAEGDAALETARLLGLETVAVPPFSPIDGEARTRVEDLIANADATIVGDCNIANSILPTLESVSESDALVLVENRSFEERNHAGSGVAAVDERLRATATVVERDGVLRAVEDVIDR